MASKTITVTEEAYEALKSLKSPGESFSETIARIAKRKPLSSFYGILSKSKVDKLEKTVLDRRKRHGELHQQRIKRVVREMKPR